MLFNMYRMTISVSLNMEKMEDMDQEILTYNPRNWEVKEGQ